MDEAKDFYRSEAVLKASDFIQGAPGAYARQSLGVGEVKDTFPRLGTISFSECLICRQVYLKKRLQNG